MNKLYSCVIGSILTVSVGMGICSCDSQTGFMLGQAAGSLVANMLGTPNAGYRAQTGYVPSAASGNINALLDPNLALAQVQQQMQAQEMQEFQMAKSLNPKLTLQEYRKQKQEAQWQMAANQVYAEQFSASYAGSNVGVDYSESISTSSSTSTSTPTVDHTCPLCHGSKRYQMDTNPGTYGTMDYKVRCNECGGMFMKSTGHTHIPCPQCHGKGHW